MKNRRICFLLFFSGCLACLWAQNLPFADLLAQKAVEQTQQTVRYVPDYVAIPYPNGDVPANTGVCTDLVIRALRACGVDLQKEVHEDMRTHFKDYPMLWQLKKPDPNIDHRRVPNLMTFFKRRGTAVAVSKQPNDYVPGDIVAWNLGNRNSMTGVTHIGIITNRKTADGRRYLVAHNIGGGNVLEDMLFDYTIIGHYRITGSARILGK